MVEKELDTFCVLIWSNLNVGIWNPLEAQWKNPTVSKTLPLNGKGVDGAWNAQTCSPHGTQQHVVPLAPLCGSHLDRSKFKATFGFALRVAYDLLIPCQRISLSTSKVSPVAL